MYGRCTADVRCDNVKISYDQRKEPYDFTTDIVRIPYSISYDIVHVASDIVSGPSISQGAKLRLFQLSQAPFSITRPPDLRPVPQLVRCRPCTHARAAHSEPHGIWPRRSHRYRNRYCTRYRTIERKIAYDLRPMYDPISYRSRKDIVQISYRFYGSPTSGLEVMPTSSE